MDILWSPNHGDEFVTFGTDISLYRVESCKGGSYKGQGVKISDDMYASMLSVNSDNQYMKCIAWYPKMSPDHLLAVGQANGKVVLTSFGHGGANDSNSLVGKEFVPRHARPCNYLAWNPRESQLLAEGLDKYRTDCSIVIWDVTAPSSSEILAEKRMSLAMDSLTVTKPLAELGSNGETSLSLAWFSNTPKTLVSGMNNKHLKIFDLRDTSRPQNVALTKAVNGVCIDPQCEHRLASFVERQVLIWDVRNFDKPLLTINEHRPVIKLSWCTTRSGLLGALSKDSSVVQLYDVQHTNMGSDEIEPTFIARIVQPYGQHAVSSFAWHPTHENRMLTITPSGTVKNVKVFERICVNWSSEFSLTWACGRSILQCQGQEKDDPLADDISNKMKRRALKGYGIQADFQSSLLQVTEEPQLVSMWSWFDLMKSLRDQNKLKTSGLKVPGVLSILTQDMVSDQEIRCWHGNHGQKSRTYKNFKSEERARALAMCDWGFPKDGSFDTMISRIMEMGHYERAAALAIFNLKIPLALKVLKEGAKRRKDTEGDVSLNMVAMALAGFTEASRTLWQELCSELRTKLHQPYLSAMFGFLTCDTEQYEDVINESGIAIQDRVAFACQYLPDEKLLDFLGKLSVEMVKTGNLFGVLLTGISREGIDLLQRYIDLTGDVQSASLAVINANSADISSDPRVLMWIDSYRALLDQWRLWHQRAEFDVFHKTTMEGNSIRIPQQVSVSCNFCGKSIAGSSSSLTLRTRSYIPYGSGPSMNKPKISICPSCRKPLPRCSLCLMNMGTASGSPRHGQLKKGNHVKRDPLEHKLAQFADWFTWCQTCRHGGHATHIAEWFRDHPECPVSGCQCKCITLDTSANSFSDNSLQASVKS